MTGAPAPCARTNPGSKKLCAMYQGRHFLSALILSSEAGTVTSERSETGLSLTALKLSSEHRDCHKRAKRDGTVPACPETEFGTQGLSQASEARRDCPCLPNGPILIVYGETLRRMSSCPALDPCGQTRMSTPRLSSERRDCHKRAKRDGTVPAFRTASFSSFMGETTRRIISCPALDPCGQTRMSAPRLSSEAGTVASERSETGLSLPSERPHFHRLRGNPKAHE